MRYWFIILFALFLLLSCSDFEKSLLIDDETYQNMFIEFAIINHMDKNLLGDTTTDELILSVYEHYGVTKEQFMYTHDYFESDISEQLLRIDKILHRLQNERELIDEASQKLEIETRESADSIRQRILNR